MFGDAEFSPTSDRLLIASADNSTSLWNLAPFEKIADLDVPGAARSYDWSARGTRIVTRSSDGEAALWDGVNGTKLVAFSSDSALSSASFSDDGARLVVIRKGGGGAILDASTGRAIVELDQSSNGITYIHANSLIVTRTDSAASLIALDTGRTLAELGVLDNQDGVALVNKGRWMLLHGQNGEFSLRLAHNGAFIGIVASAGVARSIEMSADGARVTIVYTDHQAALFDASPFARGLPTGLALREFVCTANADAIGPFRAADRSPSSPFAAALVGKEWNPAPGADCSPCRASFNRCATGPCGLALRGITGAAIAGRLSEDQSSRSPQRRLPPILENRAFCHGDFPPPVPWRGLRVKHTPVHSIVSFAVVRVGGVGRCRAWLAYQDLHPSHQPLSTRRRRRDEFELDARP